VQTRRRTLFTKTAATSSAASSTNTNSPQHDQRVSAPHARARTYQIPYTDNATFFRDLRTLIERPGLDHVYALWFPGGTSLVYLLQAVVFYDPAQPPDDARLTAGIAPPATVQDTTYLDYVTQIDVVVDAFRATMSWDGLIKPWFDVWLPDSTVERYVGEVIPTLTPRDIGPGGFVLLLPQRRSRLTRPFLRVPEPDGSDWLLLFDILTTSAQPGPDPAFTSEMMDRNNRLFARARDAFGGVRYPIGSLDFTSEDWQAHYGDVWQTLVARKLRFDPGGILTPGPGNIRRIDVRPKPPHHAALTCRRKREQARSARGV
jgi:cytokinin dehydrogenase